MRCALALGVEFLVVKAGSTFEDAHNLCEPKGASGERFALLFDSTIGHRSGAGRDVGALRFFNGHFLFNVHPCHIDCRDLQRDGIVALFSVDAAFNHMKAQFCGD